MNKYFVTGLVSSILSVWLVAHNLPQDGVAQNTPHTQNFKKKIADPQPKSGSMP
ncbi:hypothetical protein NHP190012_00810 [Helicobacter sp. NHP19-012]|uniref:Uncharacterized protein n=1 Tax=Helicobacter gastrofelis TaxID=2849642 RepID=A0ABM7SJX4_9HELI|nr:hypothetical protein [Helicobacter sp. NHP19-012]BCZ18439.1 hypothetical protein NHP190012_00810 [Helicobacter sp. NHP19-012]